MKISRSHQSSTKTNPSWVPQQGNYKFTETITWHDSFYRCDKYAEIGYCPRLQVP